MSGENWWQYQASKVFKPRKAAAPTIPPFKPRGSADPPKREPEPAPMIVEESSASDTAIQRIIKYWAPK